MKGKYLINNEKFKMLFKLRKVLKYNYYNLRFTIIDRFIKYFELSRVIFFKGNDEGFISTERDSFDHYVKQDLSDLIHSKINEPTVSAIYRVRNGEEYIEAAILSIAPLASEIIVVDNNSTDGTLAIVNRLIVELNTIVKIKLYHYKTNVELAGNNYLERVKLNPQGSLSKYYTYCFSLGTCDYLMKCDAHVIFTPKGISDLRKALNEKPKIIKYCGFEIYGKHLNHEPSLFKRDIDYKFEDYDKWEKLIFKDSKHLLVMKPVFLHVKRLSYIKFVDSDKNMAESKYRV